MTTAAVVLAAGGGSRFDGATHKLLARVRGRPLVAHAVDAAVAAGLDATYVVVGAVELPEPIPAGVVIVRNQRWADGLATSLAAGIAAAGRDGHDAVVVGLGDQPGVTAEAWRRVAAATSAPVAFATYGGERGHPVRLAAEIWRLLPTEGDAGARSAVVGSGIAPAEVPCPGSPADVDTVEDLTQWS